MLCLGTSELALSAGASTLERMSFIAAKKAWTDDL
jgi:hypothetical protein